MKKLIASAICACVIVVSANAQTTQRFTASKSNEYGLVYSLPLTELDITVETRHTNRQPGEFYNYARRHLALSGAITEPSTEVEIASVTIVPRGVANPDNQWMVQFKSGSTPWMLLTADGRPLTINSDTEAELPEVTLPAAQPRKPTILETDVARQAMTQEMIRSSSLSKRAELAAARIFELRETRGDLLSGQADNPPADGRAMQLVLDNLASQEAALTAMFAGTEQTWTTVSTLTVRPDSSNLQNEIIARISPFDGVVDADNLAGSPLYLSITVNSLGRLPVNDKGEEKKFPKGGVAYQIPGTATVSLEYEGRVVASQDVSLAQLGVTFGIDPALFTDKKEPSQLRFDPVTGGILLLGPAER